METLSGLIGIIIMLGFLGYTIDHGLGRIANALEQIVHALRFPANKS